MIGTGSPVGAGEEDDSGSSRDFLLKKFIDISWNEIRGPRKVSPKYRWRG